MLSSTRFGAAFLPRRATVLLSVQFSFGNSAKVLPCSTNECDEFLPWLERKAGIEVSSVLSIGSSTHGRSLFASRCIHSGDCILKIPYSVQLRSDNILPEIQRFLGDAASSHARLALLILFEENLGQASEWEPYISCLPQMGMLHSTVFWSKDELDMVQCSPVYQETIHHKACIEKDFIAVQQALGHLPHYCRDVTFEKFMHAYALVESRAWGTSSKELSLIPFADFLNHDGRSEGTLLSNEDKEISEVIADRGYSAGEEVLISYGKFSNASLLLDYGFTLPYNTHDQVQIWFGMSQFEPFYEMKLELLDKHQIAAMDDANGIETVGNHFTIREVKSARGWGRGIPLSLRAFARVMTATSCQELEDLVREAAQNDGRLARRPLMNKIKEIEAHQMLLERIETLMQGYSPCILSMQLKNTCTENSQLEMRRKMAIDLLSGELRVLRSASMWLKNYCTSLSGG
ncbi:ribulose-1,5 bisphosphate carboxylase/oxygenase large subunit N-methyltransferase, chloroplastic isoform X3 [Amborella trichopoda]|uniref:ribulose-1,5 bisphosphate carboxylase/oxygenase large subunit N-methyltransferase, chloroplastic isoform X3 n=1 Tax=Amborella trichopoda TaxID=13333 RepID=UPI0009C1262F|nr:ribulose-1,5 bisphosphate carboxylase/oxygenase large subunit N-methyltransferase, chloroplastic isoform X3 [Amborella trichopoda]|eukprot:XP_020530496.1 ribulose-1,5 bisphosphate carboxylase/oxygenase large subunit N-methyltransferase, chloroplastic isoform X3 [Amborella trichopoda]